MVGNVTLYESLLSMRILVLLCGRGVISSLCPWSGRAQMRRRTLTAQIALAAARQ